MARTTKAERPQFGKGADAAAHERPRWRRFWPLAVIFVGMVALYLSGVHEVISLATVIRERDALLAAVEANLIAVAASYVAVYVVAVALSFPGASLFTIVGGFLFGAVFGALLTVVAATVGATAIFLAARTSIGAALRARAGRSTERLAQGFEDNAFSYLLFLRLVPVFPFWLINVAPALFEVRVKTYVAATALGIMPGTFAYALLGSQLDGLIAAQEAANPGCAAAGTCKIDFAALLTPGFIVALCVLAAAALIPVAVKRVRNARRTSRHEF